MSVRDAVIPIARPTLRGSQHGIHDAEDDGIDADAERECADGDEEKSWSLDQLAKRGALWPRDVAGQYVLVALAPFSYVPRRPLVLRKPFGAWSRAGD